MEYSVSSYQYIYVEYDQFHEGYPTVDLRAVEEIGAHWLFLNNIIAIILFWFKFSLQIYIELTDNTRLLI